MKKLLVALMVLATFASCGKNNSVSSSPLSTSPLTVSTANASSLASYITNYTTSFGSGYTNSAMTWNQLIANQPNLTYYYYKEAISSLAPSNCSTTLWGFLNVCTTSSSSSSATLSRTVVNSSVNIVAKQNELIAILNKSRSIQQSGTAFYVYTTDAKLYILDLKFPIQAQPVQTQDSSSTEVFTNAI
ncbi:MAG: hypothetical protein ACXVLQ_03270 [Bacteriovorax sp.]